MGLDKLFNFPLRMLDKLTSVCYNGTPERETGLDSLTFPPLQKDYDMQNAFGYDARQAKIQGLSVQVGELFADLYKDTSAQAEALEALEAYKSLRRLLPREYDWDSKSRHIGATAAYKATQGFGT
jgi:hypothetical protein